MLFEAAAWLVCWGDLDWFVDMIGAAIAWVGVNVLRGGCEEFLLNRNSADFGVIGNVAAGTIAGARRFAGGLSCAPVDLGVGHLRELFVGRFFFL